MFKNKRIAILLSVLLVLLVTSVASATTVKHPKINSATPAYYYDDDYNGWRTEVDVAVGLNAGGSTAWVRGKITMVYPGSNWHTEWSLYPSGGLNSSQQAMWDKFFNYTVAVLDCQDSSSAATAYNSTTTHQTSLITIYDYAGRLGDLRFDHLQCGDDTPPPL